MIDLNKQQHQFKQIRHDFVQKWTENAREVYSQKHQLIESNSSSTSTNGGVSTYLKDIPSRKLNMYINPREIPPLPPAATLKRTSLMSSMKTNLDADDM